MIIGIVYILIHWIDRNLKHENENMRMSLSGEFLEIEITSKHKNVNDAYN